MLVEKELGLKKRETQECHIGEHFHTDEGGSVDK